MYDINHLHDLPWLGDARLSEFMDTWFRVLGDQQDEVKEGQKDNIFYRKIKKSTALRPFVDYYDRIEDSHEDHCYRYLETSVLRYMGKSRMDKTWPA